MACSCIPGSTCPYTSSVMAAEEWAEALGDHADRHAGHEQQRAGRVPQVVEADGLRQLGPLQGRLEVAGDEVSVRERLARRCGEDQVEIPRVEGSEPHGVLGLGAPVRGEGRQGLGRERDGPPAPLGLRGLELPPGRLVLDIPAAGEHLVDGDGAALHVLPAQTEVLGGPHPGHKG